MRSIVSFGLILALGVGTLADAFAAPPEPARGPGAKEPAAPKPDTQKPSARAGRVAAKLAAAGKAGRPVFLLVTEPGARKLDILRASAKTAIGRLPQVVLIEMDRTVPANGAIVKRYGLAGGPMPLILVLAPNGAPAGGARFEKKASDRLVSLVPSPRKADTLLALFQGKAAFVVVARPDMPSRAAALAACTQAVAELGGKAAVVEVDPRDKRERDFLQVLGANLIDSDVVVHVYAFSGRKSAALRGAVTSKSLVEAAHKKQECCPGGKCG